MKHESRLLRGAAKALDLEHDPPRDASRKDRELRAIGAALAARARRRRVARVGVIAGALLAAAGVALFVRASLRSQSDVTVVAASGAVFSEGARPATPIAVGASARFGDHIRTARGSAQLALGTGTRLDLDADTELTLTDAGQAVRLERGRVTASVAKVAPSSRFVIHTGDAEVEVRGTVFSVERLHTPCEGTKVVVSEGRVVVRHGGDEVATLTRDERWQSPCLSAASAPSAVSVEGPAPAERAPAAAVSPLKPTSRAPAAAPAPASPAPASATELAAQNAMFSDAMAKSRSDRREAVRRLDAFVVRYPASPLVEAAMAQRLRLLAADNDARAPAAAREYVARFPNGFARSEADALLDRR